MYLIVNSKKFSAFLKKRQLLFLNYSLIYFFFFETFKSLKIIRKLKIINVSILSLFFFNVKSFGFVNDFNILEALSDVYQSVRLAHKLYKLLYVNKLNKFLNLLEKEKAYSKEDYANIDDNYIMCVVGDFISLSEKAHRSFFKKLYIASRFIRLSFKCFFFIFSGCFDSFLIFVFKFSSFINIYKSKNLSLFNKFFIFSILLALNKKNISNIFFELYYVAKVFRFFAKFFRFFFFGPLKKFLHSFNAPGSSFKHIVYDNLLKFVFKVKKYHQFNKVFLFLEFNKIAKVLRESCKFLKKIYKKKLFNIKFFYKNFFLKRYLICFSRFNFFYKNYSQKKFLFKFFLTIKNPQFFISLKKHFFFLKMFFLYKMNLKKYYVYDSQFKRFFNF